MTEAPQRRINARLPEQVARKLAYLEKRTGRATTEVILESIERYYAAMLDEERTAAYVLAQTGFVACADGPADLSTTYKNDLTRSLGRTS